MRADFEEEEDGGGDLGLASASEEAGGCRAAAVVAFPPPPCGNVPVYSVAKQGQLKRDEMSAAQEDSPPPDRCSSSDMPPLDRPVEVAARLCL